MTRYLKINLLGLLAISLISSSSFGMLNRPAQVALTALKAGKNSMSNSAPSIVSTLHAPQSIKHITQNNNAHTLATHTYQQHNQDRSRFYLPLYGAGVLATTAALIKATIEKEEIEKRIKAEQDQLKEAKIDEENELHKLYKPLFVEARAQYDEDLLNKPWGEVSKKYIEWRDTTQEELFTEFLSLAGCTKKDFFMQCRQDINKYLFLENLQFNLIRFNSDKGLIDYLFKPQHSAQDDRISPALQTCILDSLRTAHINPKSIKWTVEKHPEAAMSVSRQMLFINTQNCNKNEYTRNKQKLMHEIQHIFWDDHFKLSSMEKILTTKKVDTKTINSFIFKFQIFLEKRADILGCLADISCAKMYYDELEGATHPGNTFLSSTKNNDKNNVHGTYDYRFAYIDKLYQEMSKPSLAYKQDLIDKIAKSQVTDYL